MIRVPKRLALVFLGLGGIFGMRTPPEPEVVAQMQPARGSEGSAGPLPVESPVLERRGPGDEAEAGGNPLADG